MRTAFAILLCSALLAPACASSGASGGPTSSTMREQKPTDDATITARVKTVLLNDTQLNATRIDVSTTGGVVTVSGMVKSQAEVERAVRLARSVEGVKDVKPDLTVGS